MKRLNSFAAAAFLVVTSFSGIARAQGCGQISIDEGDITCCNGTETQQDRSCGGSGNQSYFCSEGSGECCGTNYSTTNVTYDPEDCGSAPPPSCCNGGITCSSNETCITNEHGSFGCGCQPMSPIIVDTSGRGFRLTSAEDGVTFDIAGDGHPIKISWTAMNSGDAFLALDRNHNGRIDSGKELFGNFTEQPGSDHPNGYLALAEFDKPENGGNGDGIIDSRDAVYSKLLLWIDENHDGISEPNELHSLPELGVFSISLHYQAEPFTDQYGNWFHYRAALNPAPEDGRSTDGRWTYDVFFVTGEGSAGVTSHGSHSFRLGDCGRRRKFDLPFDDSLEIGWRDPGRLVVSPTAAQNPLGGVK